MKTKLLASLLWFVLPATAAFAQLYQPATLTSVFADTQASGRSVLVNFRAGTNPTPTVILHYSRGKTFTLAAVATAGATRITIPSAVPLDPGERYELQSVEFADAGGNTIYARGDDANRTDGEITRAFYSSATLPRSHSVRLSGGDMGSTQGEQWGGTGRARNLSTRGFVGAGDQAMIVGIVVTQGAKTFLFRAVGPGLSPFGLAGYVANPQMELRSSAGERITGNDDWDRDSYGDNNSLRVSMTNAGAFPLAAKDAAFRAKLVPGNYTLVISSSDGGSGVALAEAYELP